MGILDVFKKKTTENDNIPKFDYGKATEVIFEKMDVAREKLGHVNILITGKSGAGKSTLINSVFGEELTKTGIGKPVTDEIKKISKEGYPLRIYDTVGLELGKKEQSQSEKDIINKIKELQKNDNRDELIHCIWYCVVAASDRLEPHEEEFIEQLADISQVPVIVLVTKAVSKASEIFRKNIENRNLNIAKTFCILAQDMEIDEDYTKKAYGCDELVNFVVENVPKHAQGAFIAAQKVSMKHKSDKAMTYVVAASVSAAAEGFLPLPFSDSVALVPTQIGLLAAITTAYGLNIQKSTMSTVITSLMGTSATTAVGKSIVSALLKCIPGPGTLAGGMISGTIAAALTTALGKTYIKIMEKIASGEMTESDLKNESVLDTFKDMFVKFYKKDEK